MIINTVLKTALAKPVLVMLLTLLLAAGGLWQASQLPVDAVPDITNIQVQINTAAEGFSPQETEQRITYPIETAMAGLPKLEYTRSLSRYGLSQVTVVFVEGTDIYWARQQVSERLQAVRNELPDEIDAEMGPIVSGLGEIFSYTVKADATAKKADGSGAQFALIFGGDELARGEVTLKALRDGAGAQEAVPLADVTARVAAKMKLGKA